MNSSLFRVREGLHHFQWLWLIVAIGWIGLFAFHTPMTQAVRSLSWGIHTFASWELMLAGMMLPSIIPVINAFNVVTDSAENRSQLQLVFFSAYVLLWTGFSILMVGLEASNVFEVLQLTTPLGKGLSLIAVGGFQFTPLKLACLRGCRSAIALVSQYYQPGLQGAWNLGWQHGLFCLGCCWALMLEMAILGLHSFWVMALFTAIMLIERFWKYGEKFAIAIGIAFIGWGGFYLMMPTPQPSSMMHHHH
jgi:predicted metal-binding membrane protein